MKLIGGAVGAIVGVIVFFVVTVFIYQHFGLGWTVAALIFMVPETIGYWAFMLAAMPFAAIAARGGQEWE